MSIIRHHTMHLPSPSTEENALPEELGLAKHNLVKWRFVGGIFASMLVIGWIFIIVILIQEEKWQLVLVAWLLLYAAAHFCYWYFKRHHLLSIQSMICRRVTGNVGEMGGPEQKTSDAPPSYDDIVKDEPPPPEYYSVVVETPKVTNPKKSPFTFPKVFGFTPSSPSTSRLTPEAKKHKPIFYVGSTKLSSGQLNSGFAEGISSSEVQSRRKNPSDSKPPPYLELDEGSLVTSTSTVSLRSLPITSTQSQRPSRIFAAAPDERIFTPIHSNIGVVNVDVDLHERPKSISGESLDERKISSSSRKTSSSIRKTSSSISKTSSVQTP